MRTQPSARPAARSPRGTAGRSRLADATGLRPRILGAVLLASLSAEASAYTLTLTPASPQTVYLQVGVGSFTKNYNAGGVPGNNTTMNVVSTSVAAAAVGNGTAQAMTTDSTAAASNLDGFVFCTVPGQLYIGGFYRTTGATTAAARITATVPASLVNASGSTIPFSSIQWTSSGNGDAGVEVFPGGTFVNGGAQSIGSIASNQWAESCWTFSYLNNTVPAAGTFTGRVLFTLSSP